MNLNVEHLSSVHTLLPSVFCVLMKYEPRFLRVTSTRTRSNTHTSTNRSLRDSSNFTQFTGTNTRACESNCSAVKVCYLV